MLKMAKFINTKKCIHLHMTRWATWTKKVSSYGRDQLCVIITRSALQEAGADKGDLVVGALLGPSGRWAPFTKRISVTGSSKCIYLDNVLAEAAGALRGDVVEVRIRRLEP